VNVKSALKLGQVRGVALLAAATQKLPVARVCAAEDQVQRVGYGLAKKEQVQFMWRGFWNWRSAAALTPADALARGPSVNSYGANAALPRGVREGGWRDAALA